MTNTAQRICEIAERLDPERQKVLLDVAEGMAAPSRFYDVMGEDQRRELDRAITEADRGEGMSADALGRRLDAIIGRRGA